MIDEPNPRTNRTGRAKATRTLPSEPVRIDRELSIAGLGTLKFMSAVARAERREERERRVEWIGVHAIISTSGVVTNLLQILETDAGRLPAAANDFSFI